MRKSWVSPITPRVDKTLVHVAENEDVETCDVDDEKDWQKPDKAMGDGVFLFSSFSFLAGL